MLLSGLARWNLLILSAVQIYSLFLQQALAGCAILLGFRRGLRVLRKGENPIVRRIGFVFLLFMIYRSVSVLYSPAPGDAYSDLQFPLLALVFFAAVDWPRIMKVRHVRLFESLWFWAAVIAAVIGIFKFIIGFEARIGTPFGQRIIHSDRLPEGNYAAFAKFLTLTILYYGIGWLKVERLKAIRMRLAGLAVLCAGLLLTFSRACWLAVVVVIAWFTIRSRPRLFGAVAVVAVALIIAIPDARMRVIQSFSLEDWSSGRIELWKVGMEHAPVRMLFGHGIGSFDAIVTPEIRAGLPDKGVGDWHNQYLQIYIENGLLGLLIFAWLIVDLYVCFRWLLRNSSSMDAQRAAWGGIGFVSGFLIYGMFDTLLNSPILNISFWCLSGLTVGWMRYETMEAG